MENKSNVFLFLYSIIRKEKRKKMNRWTSEQNELQLKLHPVSPRSQPMKHFIIHKLSRWRDLCLQPGWPSWAGL